MENTQNIEEQLLLDYFSGTLSPEKREEVERWIHSSEENQKIARDIEYLNYALNAVNVIKSVDTDEGWKKVKNRIKPARSKIFLMWFQRIAAILVLPLLILSLYLLFQNEAVEYLEVKASPGMVASFVLPDGSKVWLNSGSSLKYPQKFVKDVRDVKLDGEAYFSVHRDEKHKFIVSTPFDLRAEVLGTEFNIEAYKDKNWVTTSLVSGSVRLSLKNSDQQILMKPKDHVIYNSNDKTFKQTKANLEVLTSWKDGVIILKNTSLKETLEILSKRYNAEFKVKNDLLYDYSFTGVFEHQDLTRILEHLRISSDIKYKYVPSEEEDDISKGEIKVELY